MTPLPTPVQWQFWNPGLDNDDLTLGEVYATLPTYEFNAYPWIVLLLENPKSPFSLHGNCNLLTHDLIHVLIGRGLFVQDEAFVIGYTMGTSTRISGFEKEFFKFCAHYLYPKKYKFKKMDLTVFDMGFMAGQANKTDLFKKDLKSMMGRKLGELRQELSINVPVLRQLYALEQRLVDSKASKRIPAYYHQLSSNQ